MTSMFSCLRRVPWTPIKDSPEGYFVSTPHSASPFQCAATKKVPALQKLQALNMAFYAGTSRQEAQGVRCCLCFSCSLQPLSTRLNSSKCMSVSAYQATATSTASQYLAGTVPSHGHTTLSTALWSPLPGTCLQTPFWISPLCSSAISSPKGSHAAVHTTSSPVKLYPTFPKVGVAQPYFYQMSSLCTEKISLGIVEPPVAILPHRKTTVSQGPP